MWNFLLRLIDEWRAFRAFARGDSMRGGRVPKNARDAGNYHRWLCVGCGMGGTKPDEKAARSDADQHAALHNFEHRYAMDLARNW